MHRFLRSIGFSNINSRQEMEKILGIIMEKPDSKKKASISPKRTYTEIRKEFAPRMGIVVRGEYDELGFFHLEHYFPYLEGSLISVDEDITVNKRVDTDAYTGMCDDLRLGISLIFYLQNSADYILQKGSLSSAKKAKAVLTGLSPEGTILLGIENSENHQQKKEYRSHLRTQLIAMAKSGNQEAIDNLTIDEIDMSSQIMRRIKTEDLYSLVETSFVPYGSESDNYAILGTIVNWSCIQNNYTQEEVYQLLINCNDIIFSICINRNDLTGEPMIGRRFKGVIWMQGYVDFQNI